MTRRADVTGEELTIFLVELREQIQAFEEGLLGLEREPGDSELLARIFRCAHTLKGSSSAMGYATLANLTHAMEDLLDKLRKGAMALTPKGATVLLEGLDLLKELASRIENDESADADIGPYVEMIDRLCSAGSGSRCLSGDELRALGARHPGRRIYEIRGRIPTGNDEAPMRVLQLLSYLCEAGELYRSSPTLEEAGSGEISGEFSAVLISEKDGSFLEELVALVPELERVEVAHLEGARGAARRDAAPAPPAQVPAVASTMSSVRIDVSRLDMFMDLLGELVIDRTRLLQLGADLEGKYESDGTVISLLHAFEHLDRVTTALHGEIMKTRLLPLGVLFHKFPRMMRDLGVSSGKTLLFSLYGEETELDRQIIDQIADPLTHILRNAVDHGIEPPEERRRMGKPEEGRITLSARHHENQIAITIEDDGRGMDIDRIREKAIASGLAAKSAVEKMTERELLNFVFLPGFSTRDVAGELSGRGVGMDIVRANIEKLCGSVILDTERSAGTRVTIRLPLTLSIVKSLLVTLGGSVYAFHLYSVIEALHVSAAELRTVKGRGTINLRGETIPIFGLGELLGVQGAGGEELQVVVVNWADEKAGFIVDSLIGDQEIVVKPLSPLVGEVDGVSGAAILGSGEIALILDVSGLYRLIVKEKAES